MVIILASIEIIGEIIILIVLFFVSAPYGRHARRGWGISIPARYAWMVMELPALGIILWVAISGAQHVGAYAAGFLLMWEFHYLYRTLIYPFLITPSGREFPVLLVCFGFSFNTINGVGERPVYNSKKPMVFPPWLDL
jgi:hypothetical protein